MNILTLIIFIPLLFGLIIALMPSAWRGSFKYLALLATLIQLCMAVWIYLHFKTGGAFGGIATEGQFQFVQKQPWINLDLGPMGHMQMEYFVGIDGISITLLVMTSLVLVVAALSSWEIKSNLKGFFVLFLILDMAVLGVFCSLDFFLFYIFYELMLLPLYFLIGMWGGARREYAAIKFFLYTLFGSVFMLLVMIGLYLSVTDPATGSHTFNMVQMMNPANYVNGSVFSLLSHQTLFGIPARTLGFVVLFIAFAIKVPVVPLHTWLPDAHVEAPTPVSIILAAILLKIGGYGIIRICLGIFPEVAVSGAFWLGLLGVISILYGAFNALAQRDLKRVIAYSSISQMGFVLLGIASQTAEGLSGAVMQMVSHAFLSTMLFFLAGVVYNRVHDRDIYHFRGLGTLMPKYTVFIMIAFFASLGLPGFSAFIAEAFSLMGAFKSPAVNGLLPYWMAVCGAVGILLSATYFLWTLQRMFFGTESLKGGEVWKTALSDLNFREIITLLPLALIVLVLGIMPSLVFDKINDSVLALVQFFYIFLINMHELLPDIPGQLTRILGDIHYFIPEIYLALLFVVILLTDLLFGRNTEKLCRIVACAGMLLVIVTDMSQLMIIKDQFRFLFSGMLLQSHISLIFRLIIDGSAFILLLYFAWDEQLRSHPKKLSDLYTITIAAILGLHLMTMAANMLSVYLSIEMVSLASYLLVAYRAENMLSTEAGLKYVLFGAASSAILLYGLSLLYGFGGTLSLFDPNFITALMQVNTVPVAFALILVLMGIGFKLSYVPMHFWVPDVYEGAPTPITAFLLTVPKIAAFGLLVNFLTPFISTDQWKAFDFRLCLSVIGTITMITGNFAAVLQNNAKRMLAYSSIGHTGFILMAIVTFAPQGIIALTYYLAVYAIANIGALALVTYFTRITGSEDMDSYRGLGAKYPAASVCFIIILISLTGLPVTTGFTAKLLVFSTVYGIYQRDHNTWLLIMTITGAVTTVVSLFYYIKIPLNLFLKRTDNAAEPLSGSNNLLILAIIISLALIFFGIFPDLITRFL